VSEERPGDQLHEEAPPTPRWVKVFGGVALAAVLVFVILLVFGSGHGPGRHIAPVVPGDSPSSGAAPTELAR
jgi:hypothetical protein